MKKIAVAVVVGIALTFAACGKERWASGPEGDAGAQGPAGPQGRTGEQGVPGAQGQAGPRAHRGRRARLGRKAIPDRPGRQAPPPFDRCRRTARSVVRPTKRWSPYFAPPAVRRMQRSAVPRRPSAFA